MMGNDVLSLINIFIPLLFPGKVMVSRINKVPVFLVLRMFSVQQTVII